MMANSAHVQFTAQGNATETSSRMTTAKLYLRLTNSVTLI